MALFTNFSLGTSTFGDAHRFITKHKLWWYVFLPGIINLAFILLIIFFGFELVDCFTEWVYTKLGLNAEHTGFLKVLFSLMKFIVGFLLKIALFFFYLAIYKYLILAILSPFLAMLSEKVEEKFTGKTYPFVFKHYVQDILRGLKINFRNMFVEILWIVLLFFISFIPLIGFIVPVILFLVSSYFYGFAMMDYSLERYRLSVKESIKFARKNKGFAIANGIIFYLLFIIPVIGLLVAPSYSCVAAAIGCEKIRVKENKTTIVKT